VLFRLVSGVRKRPRQGLAALLLGCGLAFAAAPTALAQSTWGGTANTSDYNDNNNWTPAAAPIAGGQSAIFDTTGSSTVTVTAGPIAPGRWTFNSTAQSFSISGADVNFSPGVGVVSAANANQFISIANNIGGAGVQVWVVGNNTLQLSGTNTYTGGTQITSGTVQVTNVNSVGTGAVLLNGGTFQSDGAANLTFTNDFSATSSGSIFDANGTVLTLSGTISDFGGSQGFVQITDSSGGSGTTVLSGTNTYSFSTGVTNSTVQVTNNSSVGSGTVFLNGGRFQADGFSDLTFTNNFFLSATGGVVDNNGTVLTLSGVIADIGGPGVLTITDSAGGTGTTVLSGPNTYSGGTKVVGATLQVTNNSSVGSGAVTLDDALFQADGVSNLTFANNFKINNSINGSAIDSNGTVLTIAGNITDGTGAGKLTVLDNSFVGGGVVVLTGNNTYSGGTSICFCATLQLGDATHTASLVGAITNQGLFDIVNANTAGITSITTDGGFTTFFGNNSAGTATLTNKNGGTLAFLGNSTAGNAVISNHNAITLFGIPGGTDISTAGNATFDNNNGGVIFSALTNAGTANITNRNGGGTIFTDASSAASATITNNNGGFTSFGQPFSTDTATAGNAVITNNSGGETDFNGFATAGNAKITTNSGAFTQFFDNSTGGTAQFITNGTGFVDFSQSLGPNGDGRITVGSIAGSGTYYIGAGNALIVGGNNLSTTMSGVIADFNPSPGCGCPPIPGIGNFEKAGTGNLILSGINTYTGTTTVNGGTLSVNGSILASSGVTVNAGGTLGGNGIVGNTIINGGTLAPGNSIGVLNVQGNLVFTAAASYMVEVSPANADRTNVTGMATLAGATVKASFAAGTYVEKQYTILNAAGGFGGSTFGTLVNTNLPTNFKTSLSYDATNAYMNLVLSFVPPPSPNFGSGLNTNQQNVGNSLVNFFNTNGGIPLVFGGLTPVGLTQVSGETATGSQQGTFDAMNLFLGLITDPFIDGRGGVGGNTGATPFADEGGASAYAANKQDNLRSAFAKFATKADVARNDLFDPRWSIWGSAYGGGSTTNGNVMLGSNSATARAFGLAAGADYKISPATLVGFALAGGGTNFAVNGFGNGRSDLFQAGIFGRHNVGSAYITAALAYGWQDVTTDRTVTIAGVDRLRAEFNANAYSGRAEGGYRFATPWLGITPYAAGQFTTYHLPAYAEQVLSGANTFALSYAAKDVTASRTELGLRTDKSFAMQNAILTLRGRAAWAHDFNTDRNVTALFQTLPGAAFVVNGAAQAHDSALATASAETKWLNGFSLAATFEGQFSSVTNSYAGKGIARYSW
jgi:autotransporter-associated beta strand protein